jgi:hypothetical protein
MGNSIKRDILKENKTEIFGVNVSISQIKNLVKSLTKRHIKQKKEYWGLKSRLLNY